jgi:hypothetical protein
MIYLNFWNEMGEHMTIRELIERLRTLPENSIVVTEGYEEGFDSVKKVFPVKLTENTTRKWYAGKYVESMDSKGLDAVLLFAHTKADNK